MLLGLLTRGKYVLKLVLNPKTDTLNTHARLPSYSHISSYTKEHLHWLPSSTRIEYKVLLIILKAQMGVAPKYLRDSIRLPTSASSLRPLYAPLTGVSSLFLGLGQPWPCLDLFPLLALLFGIAFHLQLVLLSYHQILLYVLITS